MKIALKVTAILLLLSITVIQASADSGHGWYISKRPGCTPGFPEDARFLEEHHCYFIDRSCEKSGDKVIYLTFDAGYENGNVEKILDTLRDKSVPSWLSECSTRGTPSLTTQKSIRLSPTSQIKMHLQRFPSLRSSAMRRPDVIWKNTSDTPRDFTARRVHSCLKMRDTTRFSGA